MPRPVSPKTSLIRLLDDSDSPICLLDADRRIVFCNQSLAECLDSCVDEILGQVCQYHSEPRSMSTADEPRVNLPPVNGLCPPRSFFAARHARGHVQLLAKTLVPTQETAAFPASFHTMFNRAGEMIGMLIVVEPTVEEDESAQSLTEAQSLHDEIWRLRGALHEEFQADNLIGKSPAMRRVRQQLELAARVTSSVIVLGPLGSGREHAARTIHAMADPQKDAPLVPLSASLLDAELLGNTITTLLQRCAELETARIPTLLLLDADQLAEDAQTELLGILSIHELGLRTLATSSCSLVDMAGQSRFHGELAEMLSTIVVQLPPLFQRPEDVPLIAQFFIERHNAGSNTRSAQAGAIEQFVGFSQPAMERLVAYPWPGNVGELRDVVRECLETAEPPMIDIRQLPHRIKAGLDAALNPVDVPTSVDLEAHLAEVERGLVRLALRRADGNKTQAAKSLGVSRAKLLRRIAQLGIDQESRDPEV